ncbi:MAG: NERD domain-containing protein [Eubacterium sp.]
MAIFDHIKEAVTGVKPLNSLVFLKEEGDLSCQREKLQAFLETAADSVKPLVEKDIKLLEYGIYGENQLAYELRNSHMPMVVIHDLNIEHEGLTAQIDYLIITRKLVFIVECKNLFGNISVDNQGNFIRTLQFGKRYQKEGIYSPITQNRRHMELLKAKRLSEKKNLIGRVGFDHYFDTFHRSVVVIANSKTVLDIKYAKKEIKDQIIRCDALIDYIRKMEESCREMKSSDKEMLKLGEYFLSWHVENTKDYSTKYGRQEEINPEVSQVSLAVEESELYKKLKNYRTTKSRAENVKAYFIFTNEEMENIINTMPQNIQALRKIRGFGEKKCEKYGAEILAIVAECQN